MPESRSPGQTSAKVALRCEKCLKGNNGVFRGKGVNCNTLGDENELKLYFTVNGIQRASSKRKEILLHWMPSRQITY